MIYKIHGLTNIMPNTINGLTFILQIILMVNFKYNFQTYQILISQTHFRSGMFAIIRPLQRQYCMFLVNKF